MKKKIVRQIAIALLVTVLLLVLYDVFVGRNSQLKESGLVSVKKGLKQDDSSFGEDADMVNERILKIIGSVKDITLNDDIFSDPAFYQLKDNNFVIPRPSRIGRSNPFSAIGSEELGVGGLGEPDNPEQVDL